MRKARQEPRGRPAQQNDGKNPAHVPAIDHPAEEDRSQGKSDTERPFNVAVLLGAQVQGILDQLGHLIEGEPIHVIDHGSEE